MKINIEKSQILTPLDPLCPQFRGGFIADSSLKIRDVMPPYLKTLFEQRTEN